MSKPNTHDKIAAIDIVNGWIELNIRNGFETDEVRRELARIQQTLETRKQKLLAPAQPKKPKASRKQDSEWTVQAVNTVIPVPTGLRHTDNAITKRSKR